MLENKARWAEQSAHAAGLQYNFGPFCLCPDGTLLRNLAVVALTPRELTVLRLLVSRAGETVPIEEIRELAWGGTHVSADSLPRCISSLRARLKYEDSIQTFYKRGYRFNIPVKQTPANPRDDIWTERRASPSTGLPRLAILPFTTTSGIPEFFGVGIAEEVMVRLSRNRSPVVEIMARDSVCTLVARGIAPLDVGNALRADLVLIGTLLALPEQYRVRVEMVRVVDSVQLWIEDFLIPRDLLSHADARVAKRVTARIRDTFTQSGGGISLAASAAASTSVKTINEARRSEAYSIFLQSRAHWNTLQRHLMQDAIRGFHHALELDPSLISARIHLVHSYLVQSYFGYIRPDLSAEMARKQAEMVLAQSPNSQSVHPALGWIHFHHDRDPIAAARAFAHSQGPGYSPSTTRYRIKFALGQGRFADAIAISRASIELDGFSPLLHSRLAWSLHLSGDPEGALEQARRTLQLFPGHIAGLFYGSMIFAATDHDAHESRKELGLKATALATHLIQIAPSFDPGYAALAYSQARQGHVTEARALMDRLQWLGKERYVLRSYQVPALVELGDLDGALAELNAAEHLHCPSLFEILSDPRISPLHGRPEFQKLLSRLGPMRVASTSVA